MRKVAFSPSELSSFYATHVKERIQKTAEALASTGFDALVIHSGALFTYFADDIEAPFHSTPHFAHWTPLAGPNHLLLVRPNAQPLLIGVKPEDYWHEQTSLGSPFWLSEFKYREVKSIEAAWKEFSHVGHTMSYMGRVAYVGEPKVFEEQGIDSSLINPTELVAHMDWDRSFKTSYEAACISEANRVSAKGHQAGKEAFLGGASELEIHRAYIEAVGGVERDLPYETIVALNEKGAILHYQGKRQDERNGKSLLLDAGANYLGYASDITRTYASPDADPLFIELLAGMEKLQLGLCAEIKIGMPFAALHEDAHRKIGELLISLGILKTNAENAVKQDLIKAFFPHGVGHFLGLQVHDVGGKQKTPEGGIETETTASLRTTRIIEAGQVFTVEPGIYFIEMLLRPHRKGEIAEYFNWELIDHLAPYGGVRIEDDVFVTENGVRNLTREHL